MPAAGIQKTASVKAEAPVPVLYVLQMCEHRVSIKVGLGVLTISKRDTPVAKRATCAAPTVLGV